MNAFLSNVRKILEFSNFQYDFMCVTHILRECVCKRPIVLQILT